MLNENQYFLNGKINEECGIFGVFNIEHAASLTYYGLHSLQHRGQEAAGIATVSEIDGEIRCVKNLGLIAEVFNTQTIDKLSGIHAVGHVRYSTNGSNIIENVQPMVCRAHQGTFSVAHNGQIVNAKELKIECEKEGAIFQSSSDSEIILHLIQREKGTMVEKIKKACQKLEGAFAIIVLTKDCIYAIRDKTGLRPLSVGNIDEEGYCITSETCAFNIVNATMYRDVEPGEILRIALDGIQSFKFADEVQHKMCAMEYIYFARPDSDLEGVNVHTTRRNSGRLLAINDTVKADIVIGVPDSSLSAAQGYAHQSDIPYELGLIKNRYVGRTFIQPTQKQRERGVRMKLSAVRSIVSGKRVIMVDDSIVRGTTSKRIVQLLKDAGATEVHVRIASAPLISPCFYGVDASTYEELISSRLSKDELCEYINADSLEFLTVDQMKQASKDELCTACFTGEYPTRLFSLKDSLKRD